jgi:ectoine hydroxylase-related dioxygenase (phytanoyl-CoA dioxygenase family)
MWREALASDGFAILPDILSRQDVLLSLDSFLETSCGRSRAGIRHALSHDSVSTLAHDPRLLGIAEEVLGRGAFPFRATLFDKSPAANWLVVWHQDTALPLLSRQDTPGWGPWSVKEGVTYAHPPASALTKVLALRVHLDDSTSSNGPLRVLPATHSLGVLDDAEIHELSTTTPAVDCIVPAGGVLAMRPLILHSSSKSQSQAPRRVLHIEYAATKQVDAGLELAMA